MKVRILAAVVGIAAVLTGSLAASPALATDGPDSVRVYYPGFSGSGGQASATIDFISRTEVIYRNFTVRDLCPEDGRPVRAQAVTVDANGFGRNLGPMKAVVNGCGPNGTNFGTIRVIDANGVAKAHLRVCVYADASGNLRCATSEGRDNPHFRAL